MIGSEEAEAVRAGGVRLTRELDALLPTGWDNWQPEPGWPALEIPEGWKSVYETTATIVKVRWMKRSFLIVSS